MNFVKVPTNGGHYVSIRADAIIVVEPLGPLDTMVRVYGASYMVDLPEAKVWDAINAALSAAPETVVVTMVPELKQVA